MKKLISVFLCLLLLCSILPASALTYDELLQKASEFETAGDYDKALACYDLAIRTEPARTDAYIFSETLYYLTGRYDEATACADSALAIYPTLAEGWGLKCGIDVGKEDIASYEADMVYAEICGTDLSFLAAKAGEMYANAGYYEKAVTTFSAAQFDMLTEAQKQLYRRALIAAGEKEQAEALGLTALNVRNEKLDAAFEADSLRLIEAENTFIKPSVSDFEVYG